MLLAPLNSAALVGPFNNHELGPILVMDKMESLRQYLDRCKKGLQLPKQLSVCLAICEGLAFLLQQTQPVVHRDLSDKNVMFSFEGVAKIGDFGQSKLKDLYLTSCQPGMIPFMPPEAILVDGGFKVRVYNSNYTLEVAVASYSCMAVV